MRKDIICPNNQDFNNFDSQKVEIYQFTSGFCRMPDALFHIPKELGIKGWKTRFIVGLSYLYALSFNKEKAITTQKELMKILETNSYNTVNLFITNVNKLFERLKTEAENTGIFFNGGEFITRKGRKGGTQCYLIDQTIVAESFRHKVSHGGTFAFYNIALLLPISAQAKAILLYLHRKARNGSLLNGKAESEVSARELARVLAVGKGRIKGYLLELEEARVIERVNNGRRLKFRITRLDEWNRGILLNILRNWEGHPFIKNWKFPVEPINPQKVPNEATGEKSPIGRQKTSNEATSEKTPIGRQKFSNRETHRNKSKDRNKTKSIERNKTKNMEYDDIYIGGGEKFWNLVELLKSLGKTRTNVQPQSKDNGNEKEKRKNRQKRGEKKRENEDKRTNSYKKPDGFKNKEKAGELVKPNFAERLDKKELGKIRDTLKRLLPELRKAYPEVFTLENLKVFEELYAPALKRIYGDEWLALAVMYELFNRKAPQYGYSRKVNKNFLGLLISFALKDSSSDFWEFYKKFRRVFGLRLQEVENVGEKEQQGEQPEPRLSLSDLKEFFKKKLKDKKTIYTMFIENGIKALEKVGSKWVVKCRDSIAKEYISKNFLNLLREFLKSENIQIEV